MTQTLLQLAGASLEPTPLSKGVLVLIDMQNEYFDGPLKLDGVEAATRAAAGLLQRARAAGTPVIHIRHRGRPGGAFDPEAARGAIHDDVAPLEGEVVIDKGLPNAFADTTLADALASHSRKQPILVGFMTHMCVSSTARSALSHGYMPTVVTDAVATRALPDPSGRDISASDINRIALAELADRFAILATSSDIPD